MPNHTGELVNMPLSGSSKINTPEELYAKLTGDERSRALPQTYMLESDIVLTGSWRSIVRTGAPITFDGQGFSISGLTVPLFDTLPEGSVIRDLTLKEVDIDSADQYVGGVIGSGSPLNILDTEVIGQIRSTHPQGCVGGIAGYLAALGDSFCMVNGCINKAELHANDMVGGIIGWCSRNSTARNSINCGNTYTEGETARYHGGIVGYVGNNDVGHTSGPGDGRVLGCTNCGLVRSNATKQTTYMGGIAGYVYENVAIGQDNITYPYPCYNHGVVDAGQSAASTGTTYAGGIAGYSEGTNNSITNCTNTGDVKNASYTTGIVGYAAGNYLQVKNCVVDGASITTVKGEAGGVGAAAAAAYLRTTDCTVCAQRILSVSTTNNCWRIGNATVTNCCANRKTLMRGTVNGNAIDDAAFFDCENDAGNCIAANRFGANDWNGSNCASCVSGFSGRDSGDCIECTESSFAVRYISPVDSYESTQTNVMYGETLYKPLYEPSVDHGEFIGWYIEGTNTPWVFNPDANATEVTDDTTLIARIKCDTGFHNEDTVNSAGACVADDSGGGGGGSCNCPPTGILGFYDTQEDLIAAQPAGSPGQSYLVGNYGSYHLYIWNKRTDAWYDVGPK
ncbi:hypothetical protein FACS1894184_07860 [Clostridia bacterium]|nr:hypothetical protein FACS1894184_07860 [Clostridia bacterium]